MVFLFINMIMIILIQLVILVIKGIEVELESCHQISQSMVFNGHLLKLDLCLLCLLLPVFLLILLSLHVMLQLSHPLSQLITPVLGKAQLHLAVTLLL